MVRSALAIACVCAAIAGAAGAATKPPGTAVARAKGTGPYAVAVAHGQVDRPKALYARLVGKVARASIRVECLVGSRSTPRAYERRRPGLYRLPVIPASSDVCHVTVTLYGSGPIVAEVRARR